MFLGSLIRTLRGLQGGLARFLPCGVGAHHCRLCHVGWEKCGHGLTSRPRETSEPLFLDSLLGVFGYPSGSGRLLLVGDLPLRYYTGNLASRKPTWRPPPDGGVRALVTDLSLTSNSGGGGSGPCWTRGAAGFWKRMRLTKKNGQFYGSASWGFACLCMVQGGNVFMFLGMFWVLRAAVLRGGA